MTYWADNGGYWRYITPADFARAFANEPQVLDLLGRAGALSSDR